MVKKLIFVLLFVLFFASCRNKREGIPFNLNGLKEVLLSDKENGGRLQNKFYEAKTILSKNEKDIWINTKYPQIYDSVLTFFNLKFETIFSDTIFNSWATDSIEIMLFQKSDSLILISILEK